LGDIGVDGRKILKYILKWNVAVRIGFNWLRRAFVCGLLCTR